MHAATGIARAEPVVVAKQGRPVVVVMAVEEFERLKALDALAAAYAKKRQAKEWSWLEDGLGVAWRRH